MRSDLIKYLRKFFILLGYLLPYIFVFIASLYRPADLDLGWHIKYGEYFFQHHQILRENTFSTMMPGYRWANGSWGTDVLTYTIFKAGGFFGLTVASAVIVTLTFFFFSKAAKFKLLDEVLFFPFLVYLESTVNADSFRGQQISLFLLGVLSFILSRSKTLSRILLVIPILFLLWSNLHQEVFLGLTLFSIWAITKIIGYFYINRQVLSKEILFLGGVFLLSLLATFINPFGLGIHKVAFIHFSDAMLSLVKEYHPIYTFPNLLLNHLVILGLILFGLSNSLHQNKKPAVFLPFLIPFLFLFVMSMKALRYAWPTYYFAIFFIPLITQMLMIKIRKYAFQFIIIFSLISIVYVIKLKTPLKQFATADWDTYCENGNILCSPKSAEFLINNNLTTKVFSHYGWGGWLIWNYPEIKPNLDGRMHLWRDENGYSALETDYLPYITTQKSIDDSPYNVIYLTRHKKSLYQKLVSKLSNNEKWSLAYVDEDAIIFVRKE